jgi:hypothetical protein
MATGAEDTTIRLVVLRDTPSHPVRHDKEEEEEEKGEETKAEERYDMMTTSRTKSAVVVIKKHTTGIQALQWSRNGAYLFSSGGFEEFYVWRVRCIAGYGIGVVCEAVCPAQSDVPDLRITDFDACPITPLGGSAESDDNLSGAGFLFSMCYSDSSVRVSRTVSARERTFFSLSFPPLLPPSPHLFRRGVHSKTRQLLGVFIQP